MAWRIISLLGLLAVVTGCGRGPEALISRQIALLSETADTLASITDEASAKAAAPKLVHLQRAMDALVPQVKALKLSEEDRQQLEDEHRDAMQSALGKYEAELQRVRGLKLRAGGLSELEKAIAE
jgi:hypothetical protein